MLLHHSWGSRHLNQGHDPQANPHREGIERTDVGVIPLTWLKRRLVQVHDNGNARHDKQHRHDRRSPRVSVRLEHQAHEAQDQRQVEELVQSPVLLHVAAQHVAVAQALGVDGVHPTQPVAIEEAPVALHVVLLPNEIPKEVAEVHPSHLVVGEEPQVLSLGGHQFFQHVVQPALGLQGPSNVLLVPGLVGHLGGAAQLLLERLLFALQSLHEDWA